jgi:predicted transcriptional regulator
MTLPNLNDIKKLRKKYSLNQKDLASKANVSQSLIAKIEAGKIEPTYAKVKKIFSALEELRTGYELKAKDLMNKKILFAKPEDSIIKITNVMKEKGISQLPVKSNENVLGIVNETIILKAIAQYKEKFSTLKVEDVMEDCPPIVSFRTRQSILLELLKENNVILIAEKGKVKGIVTKSDMLGVF